MKIISFAWTSPALLALEKSRTRRAWNDAYASRFKVGDLVQAWDRSPRFGGKQIAIIQVMGLKKENLLLMSENDYVLEGFAYFEKNGLKIRGQDPRVAFDEWKQEGGDLYVLDFRVVSITPPQVVGNSGMTRQECPRKKCVSRDERCTNLTRCSILSHAENQRRGKLALEAEKK